LFFIIEKGFSLNLSEFVCSDVRSSRKDRVNDMESEILAYVVSNDGVICHLPVTSELLSLLEQLKQGGAKERRGGPDEGARVGELVQVLKRAMHPPVSLACEDSSQEGA
jgi:hypothetical protein